jgi:hypothetical protein
MADDDKPDPLNDVKKGLGLLFRAARTAATRLSKEGAPLDKLEEVVRTGAREVGRAFENVTNTVVGAGRTDEEARPTAPDDARKDPDTDAAPKAKTPSDKPPPSGSNP